ncbi:CBS domain containing membrane protein [Desulfamplus magnetovallimortis]|uniref:CBS domain containing membrane protein n=1 Tax=Desulfamplus magnetovallimortis TaxID=1246637 RepID=L0R453_9BACT|nr:CBS domain-containing protein [Desulfamplus magnetovallimortis]CCO06838.1 CBS domain containing membrane protein [Desulfamplus magnetovallimortis BW-1]SLM32889.1 CBS domain containing membrane protein [Desulfamplus magnetovallimortis]
MPVLAKDIMVTNFDTINHNEPIETAIKMIFCGKIRETGDKTTSLMVIDDHHQFVGIVTMFDILYHLRPGILNYGVSGENISWVGQIKQCKEELKKKKVRQIMSSEIVGALPDEHIMVLLDRMVRNKYHRLPILQNSKPLGIVYISDIYFHLFARDGIVNKRKE